MSAWIFQDTRQKARLGDKCNWSAGWIDPDGKKRSKKIGSKSMAEKYARKVEGQIAAGLYQNVGAKTWQQFKNDFESKVLAGMEPGTKETTKYALNHFERIIKPARMRGITSATIAEYIAVRRQEGRTKRSNSRKVSPATINRELRTIRAVLRKAKSWKYLAEAPEIEFLREPGKLPRYVTPEDFTKLYDTGCEAAMRPDAQSYTAAEWWRGLLMFSYLTGWRIGQILSLRWEDVDLDNCRALSRHADTKGRRDQLIHLHPVAIEHLRGLRSFSPLVFAWPHDRRQLYEELATIRTAAGIRAAYGFHDLRRAFATMNAENMTPDALQRLMQHKDYQTTQRYINMARQLKPAVEALFVPTVKARA